MRNYVIILQFQVFWPTENCCMDNSKKKNNKTQNFLMSIIAQKELQYFENVAVHRNW